MLIRFVCANCGFVFDIENNYCGGNITCPECGSNACDKNNKGEWEL